MSVITPEEMPAFEGKGAPVQCSVAVGEQSVAKYNEAASNRVRVECAVIRLPEETTDILVAVNTPIEVHPESTSAHAAEAPQPSDGLLREVLASFNIVDYGLFC